MIGLLLGIPVCWGFVAFMWLLLGFMKLPLWIEDGVAKGKVYYQKLKKIYDELPLEDKSSSSKS